MITSLLENKKILSPALVSRSTSTIAIKARNDYF